MSTFKTTDGTQIYFKDWGTGKPVLFSHGWPLDADMWDSQMNFLAGNGYRVIAFDRRGFGRSDQPWTGNDYDTFASDINDLITHLDLQNVTLVGFSMGGGDVTRYIGSYGTDRVAALVLLGAVTPIFGKTADYPQGVDMSVFEGIRDGLLKDRAQFIKEFATPFYGTNAGQTVSDGVMTQTLNIALLASLKSTVDCVTAFAETDFRADVAKVNVPTLVIHGSNDQIVPFESTGKVAAEMIEGAELKVYDNAPHGFAVTHQDQLNQDLLAFLNAQFLF
ncbi:alpha/beta hydrolase [Pantoea sp. Bo_2]|uniref:alpha/beta fold hydrolase n=2 Tax=unclassified Pantoea TaxID=2630326 RepID=UPI0012321243|nr:MULTISPECIES: alpha/beta hydrolase [unclassified Pantoea]KAA5948233.1 alpha/beta hydrolase [Pantoea sp. VH_3]KAA5953503.1 alpha/beta hydrolase [Pantoea sp. VH_25]KAA5985359.1 alpha/beta hydrolase [Pantoea sp. M_3]KAA6047329.1 alpha/beta hydrolase [Pantoea sp. FN_2b]KAA6052554.1 alpha/beta hydrolase [Pantoea sp. Bo_5]